MEEKSQTEIDELQSELKKLEEQYEAVILPEEKSAEKNYEEKTQVFRKLREELQVKEKEKDTAEKRWQESVKQSQKFLKKMQKIQKKIDKLSKEKTEERMEIKQQSDDRKFKIFPKDKDL